jgi:HlyD family secretion protein
VVVGAELGGRILQLPVQEKSVVRQGDLIAELQADDLKASLAEARAHVAEADADIWYFRRELDRARRLLGPHASSQLEMDGSQRSLETARAHRDMAAATAARYEALIAKTHIVAPIDGVVTARHVQPGETVDASARLVTIADLNRVRIEAEVDEYDAGRVALGAAVKVTAEGYDNQQWQGRVEEIPDSVVGRRIKPEDPGRPTDTRVLLVKVALAGRTPLKLGQRVEVEIVARR